MAKHPWNPRLLRHYGRQRRFLERLAASSPDTMNPEAVAAAARDLLLHSSEVLGGEEVPRNADPFRDCCLVWDRAQPNDFGSGVYLGQRIVITAAHVVDPARAYHVSLPLTDERDRKESVFNVTDLRLRRNDPLRSGGQSDLALLLLKSEPTGITPPLLPQPADFRAAMVNPSGVSICGFGQAWDPAGIAERRGLKRAANHVQAHPSPPAPAPDPEFDAEFEFLAGGRSSGHVVDTCFGDSGGPLYAAPLNESHLLLGLTSRGIGSICGNGGIYTRVDAHLDWILRKAREFGSPLQ